jgi:glycosyltransferase involved in cell wall biosynthesis
MKKIVLAIGDLRGNGAERFVLTMAKAFIAAGHDAHVVIFRDLIQLPIPDGVKVHLFDEDRYRWLPKFLRRGRMTRQIEGFIKAACNGTPDLIISNSNHVDAVLAHSRLKNVYPVVHTTLSLAFVEERNAEKKKRRLHKVYSKRTSIAVSQGVCDDFQTLFPDCRIQCIHNPIDRDDVLSKADSDLPGSTVPDEFIVHVGKFKLAKRHDILLQAYARSGVQQPLLLLGEGELLDDMRELANTLGIQDRVIFQGFCANPYPYMKKASFMVASSDWEGFSVAMLEALALDLPLLSTDCRSGPNEILPKENLVPVRAVDLLAEKIQAAAQNPRQFHVPFDEKFMPEAAARKYLELLNQ